MGKVADFILCERCGGTFKPEVLTWGGTVPSTPDGTPPPLPGAMPPAFREPLHGGYSGPGFHDTSATTVSYQANGLAKKYATLMSGMHQLAFESSKGKAPKSAKYVVHCELGDNSCAFLVSVPQYRKFTDDAKSSLEEVAWSTARIVLKDEPTLKPDSELCVALKGMLMFGSVMTGSTTGSSPATNTKDEEDMDRFFIVVAEKEPVVVEKVE